MVVVEVVAFQLLEYQMVWWVCRFDTLGKLVSAHHAGVPTTPGWGVTPGRGVAALAGATFAGAATHHSGVKNHPWLGSGGAHHLGGTKSPLGGE